MTLIVRGRAGCMKDRRILPAPFHVKMIQSIDGPARQQDRPRVTTDSRDGLRHLL